MTWLSMSLLTSCISTGTPVRDGIRYTKSVDDSTGWEIYELRVDGLGDSKGVVAKIIPEAGANVYSLKVDGVELLRQPPELKRVKGVGFGMPLLYPTPNRVRGGRFKFDGKEYTFPKNSSGNHIHGFVHSVRWEAGEVEVLENGLRLPLVLDIHEAHSIYEFFPFEHRLTVVYTVTAEGLRMDFEVKNKGTRRVPFGLGVHPYFALLGERKDTELTVPARSYMIKGRFDKLPSGDLAELQGSKFDLREPTSIDRLELDDVYYGMNPDRPCVIDNRKAGFRIELEASSIFTHAVVYTPGGQDFFCLENQTCSTDAHNLYTRGKTDEAHLLILEASGGAGSRVEGSIDYRVTRTPPEIAAPEPNAESGSAAEETAPAGS